MSPTSKKRIVLVGTPNVGKSALFGQLTGTYVTVSNYPGTTVEVSRGTIPVGGESLELFDTPGTNHLVAMSEDEAVTRDVLLTDDFDLVVQVGDAKSLTRSLLLTLQLLELGVPLVLVLNMADEARVRGISIDTETLSAELGIPVFLTAAIRREGIEELRAGIARALEEKARAPLTEAYGETTAKRRADLIATLSSDKVKAERLPALATILLSREEPEDGALRAFVSQEILDAANVGRLALEKSSSLPAFAHFSKERLHFAQGIVRKCQRAEALGTPQKGGVTGIAASLGAGIAVSAVATSTLRGALSRFQGPSGPVDPLDDFGVVDIVKGIFAPSSLGPVSTSYLALFLGLTLLGAFMARRHSGAVAALWKMVFAIGFGYAIYVFLAFLEGLRHGPYTTLPVFVGAAAAILATVRELRGERYDVVRSKRFGILATDPILGLPILFVVLFFAYKIVGVFGAGTAVDLLENQVFGGVVAQANLDVLTPRPSDEDGLNDGSQRLVVSEAGTGMRRVVAETKRGGKYIADLGARIDFYPAGLVADHKDETGTFVRVEGNLPKEARLWSGVVNRAAYGAIRRMGVPFITDFIVGQYGILTMGLTYAVAIVLPIVLTFFFFFSMLEDSGYLPRLAVIANRLLQGIGLNGKAVLPMVLGLGCDTMATLTARIMESRKERVLVTLILALGIPCSSQLSVVFAMMQRTSTAACLVWVAVVLFTIFVVGWVAAKVIPGERSDFLMELPPIRTPMVKNLTTKTFARLEWYLREAAPLFLAGTALLFVLDRLNLLPWVHRIGEPIVHHILGFERGGGVSDRVSEALLIGFLRRDFGAAGLLAMTHTGRLSPADIAVSMVTITLFIPCIANVFMIVKERGAKVALLMCAFIFPYALLIGALVRVLFRIAA